MSDKRILVIGTTPDYISYIHFNYHNRALFVTDSATQSKSMENKPDDRSELVCDLSHYDTVVRLIIHHCRQWKIDISGITCFDCEYLELAANIATFFSLPFPSAKSIALCRSKYLSKQTWAEYGVRCPQFELVESEFDTIRFVRELEHPIVLKPLTGSGSELTFQCNDIYEVFNAYRAVKNGLKIRENLPMYRRPKEEGIESESETPILAEEFIFGREYSCDFIINNNTATIIRIAKKILDKDLPFGTTTEYIIPARLPEWINRSQLTEMLKEAALALGINRAICMIDFVIAKDEVVFLELTPRIGGDCLPPTIKQSCGLDMIGLALDFSEGKTIYIPPEYKWRYMVGLRLFAPMEGKLVKIDTGNLDKDQRIREIMLKRSRGDIINLPPEDYETWHLGHVIFETDANSDIEKQSREIRSKIQIKMEPYDGSDFTESIQPDSTTVRKTDSAA